MPKPRVLHRLVPAVALLLACGGADLLLPSDGEVGSVEVFRGNAQSGRVGEPLARLVVVRVLDPQQRPVKDAPVAFAFAAEGTGASVDPETAATDTDGLASFRVVLGTRVGDGTAEVRVPTADGQRILTAEVSFTALSADANEVAAVAGDGQTAPAGALLAKPLVVQVTDAFGNPISGVSIEWAAQGGGSVSQGATSTGDDGKASVDRTLGPNAGPQQTTAKAADLAGSPVTFSHTASAGAATAVERVSGDGQSALVGTAVSQPLVVRAKDADGNAVSGVAVTWVAGAGGGSLSPETSLTGDDGVTSSQWTLGPAPGTNTATAVVSGVGTVGFTATADPGTPPGLSLEVQPPASAVSGVTLSRRPLVQLREPDGTPRRRSGVQVSVALTPAGGALRGANTRATDGDGRAEFRDLSLEGPPGTYTLAFTAPGYSRATSSAITLSRAATTTSVISDEPDPSAPGAAVRVRFRVASTAGGTPTGTVRVSSDDGASCSAGAAAGECSLSLTSVGSRLLTAVYSGDHQFEGSDATEGHAVEPPAPVETKTTITSDDPDPSEVGQLVTVRFTVTSSGGTPGGSVTVTTVEGSESCTGSAAEGACSLAFLAAGDRTLTATYIPAGGFGGSSDTEKHKVREPPPPPPVPSGTTSTVEVEHETVEVGHRSRVTVVVRDAGGAALEGVEVTLTASGSGNAITPASQTSRGHGEAQFDFSSTDPGVKSLTAVAAGVTVAQQPTITVIEHGGEH